MVCLEQKIVSMYRTVFFKNSFVLLAIVMVACTGKKETGSLPYYNKPDFTPVFLTSKKEVAEKITGVKSGLL